MLGVCQQGVSYKIHSSTPGVGCRPWMLSFMSRGPTVRVGPLQPLQVAIVNCHGTGPAHARGTLGARPLQLVKLALLCQSR